MFEELQLAAFAVVDSDAAHHSLLVRLRLGPGKFELIKIKQIFTYHFL